MVYTCIYGFLGESYDYVYVVAAKNVHHGSRVFPRHESIARNPYATWCEVSGELGRRMLFCGQRTRLCNVGGMISVGGGPPKPKRGPF